MENEIPLWLKIAYTLMVAVIVPAYWKSWGPKNFLWISDIALFGLLLALWLESSMITSIMAVMSLFVEVAWLVDLLVRLIFRRSLFGLTEYMFSNKQPLFIRLLSLFHIPMLAVLFYLIAELGYSYQAILYAIPLVWIIFICTRIAKPEENINWVYGWSDKEWQKKQPFLYLAALMIVYPLFVMLPAHFILNWLHDKL